MSENQKAELTRLIGGRTTGVIRLYQERVATAHRKDTGRCDLFFEFCKTGFNVDGRMLLHFRGRHIGGLLNVMFNYCGLCCILQPILRFGREDVYRYRVNWRRIWLWWYS